MLCPECGAEMWHNELPHTHSYKSVWDLGKESSTLTPADLDKIRAIVYEELDSSFAAFLDIIASAIQASEKKLQ